MDDSIVVVAAVAVVLLWLSSIDGDEWVEVFDWRCWMSQLLCDPPASCGG
jgi:hypothetical protein